MFIIQPMFSTHWGHQAKGISERCNPSWPCCTSHCIAKHFQGKKDWFGISSHRSLCFPSWPSHDTLREPISHYPISSQAELDVEISGKRDLSTTTRTKNEAISIVCPTCTDPKSCSPGQYLPSLPFIRFQINPWVPIKDFFNFLIISWE